MRFFPVRDWYGRCNDGARGSPMMNFGSRSLLVLSLLGCEGGVLSYAPPAPPDPMGSPDAGLPAPGDPDATPPPPVENRVTDGLESIYRFDEGAGGVIHDRSNDSERPAP